MRNPIPQNKNNISFINCFFNAIGDIFSSLVLSCFPCFNKTNKNEQSTSRNIAKNQPNKSIIINNRHETIIVASLREFEQIHGDPNISFENKLRKELAIEIKIDLLEKLIKAQRELGHDPESNIELREEMDRLAVLRIEEKQANIQKVKKITR